MDDYMGYGVRTKYRKIRARVQEHLRGIETRPEQQFEPDIPQDDFEASPTENNLHNGQLISINSDDEYQDSDDHTSDRDSPIPTMYHHKMYDSSDANTSNDESDEQFGDESEFNTREHLAKWALNFNISHAALSVLLQILRKSNLDVPMDPRTLVSTPRQADIKSLAGGSYYHFGVANSIHSQLITLPSDLNHVDTLTLRVNIDGLPLFKSSNQNLWPILAMIKELPSSVFMIGVFCGVTKPSSVTAFLQEFVQDMKNMVRNGIDFNGKHFNLALPDAFICDAPARAYIKCVKGHMGYYACERCTQKGVHIAGRMTFPQINAPLRTDIQFDEMKEEEHHTGVSPLQELGIGCVTDFVLDYMHLVCLGVVRKMIALWTKGPLRCRISAGLLKVISDQLKSFRQNLPSEFSRKPRSLVEFKQWKATELRQFLLYTGPVVLRNELPNKMYRNFMLLSVSMRFLLCPALCSKYCNYVQELLEFFHKNFAVIYGKEMVVYNVHNLTHLVQDARKYGALDSVSCFPFENYLGKLKKMVRRPQDPLSQIVRRVGEKQKLTETQQDIQSLFEPHKKLHLSGPLPPGYATYRQYKRYRPQNGFFISCSQGDNCFEVTGRVVLVRNILLSHTGETHVVYEDFERMESVFKYPLDCSCLGINTVSRLSGLLNVVPIEKLSRKFVMLPSQQKNIVLPQLHDY